MGWRLCDVAMNVGSKGYGAVLPCLVHHEATKGKCDVYGAFGKHGVPWMAIDAQLCLWESLEANWIKMKHMKRMKIQQALHSLIWPYWAM